MPKFKLSPVQKAFRKQLNSEGKAVFDSIYEEAVGVSDSAEFCEKAGEGYELNPTARIEQVFESVLQQVDWSSEEAGSNSDYVEFCKSLEQTESKGEAKVTKKDKKDTRGPSKLTQEARENIIREAYGVLKSSEKPVLIEDLCKFVRDKLEISNARVYRAITDFGQGKFSVEGVTAFKRGKTGNKRNYSL